MWLSLTSVHLQDKNVMVWKVWENLGLQNSCCWQEERQICGRNAVHSTPTTSTYRSHHSHVITLIPVEPELDWPQSSHCPSVREAGWAESSPPCRPEDSLLSVCLSCHSGPNLCAQPCLPHPEVSCDRLHLLIFRSFSFFPSRLFFPLLSNSDSIAKLQLKILSFPRTYISHS